MTLGIDLASQPKKTGACVIRWGDPVVIEDPITGLTDSDLVALMMRADKVGIDVPLGWPTEFMDSVAQYRSGARWSIAHTDQRLYLRATDRFVLREIRKRPLSVSADRIAVPAMRAAYLLSQVDPGFDRTGRGRIVEVYPAASLTVWGLDANRYKGTKGAATRSRLLESFRAATQKWVLISDSCYTKCAKNDDAFDALIASLTARAASIGRCQTIDPIDLKAAASEGWIALPRPGSLGQLVG